MLKKIRVGISIILFTLISFYFLDFAALLPDSFHWLAGIQLIPALLTLNIIVIISIVLVTLLFGRIYCSSICPMGIFQDLVSWISKRAARKRKRYKFSKAKNIIRWSVLMVTIIAFALGFPLLLALIDPYSAYGRMVTNVFKPVYMQGNNILESIFTSFGNYTFYKVDIIMLSVFSLVVGILTFSSIGFLAWKYGRTYCNTICPVGTILGFLSQFSIFKVRIDTNLCNGCGSCATKCKASCIDSKNHTVDYSRCVTCFNCLSSCSKKALNYTSSFKNSETNHIHNTTADTGKRQFLLTGLTTAIAAPAALAQQKVAKLAGNEAYIRQTPISPPGALSTEHLLHHCTSCHLCISRCPSDVLKPAFLEYGIRGIMQPVMNFDDGFCNYGCTVCSNVCPNNALVPLTQEEKHMTQMGRVVFRQEICVVQTDETNCGACAEHCPTQAVSMVPYKDGLTIPSTNPDICIGCGGCEYICPVRPYRAIHVEGNAVHQKRKAFEEEKKEEVIIDNFGF